MKYAGDFHLTTCMQTLYIHVYCTVLRLLKLASGMYRQTAEQLNTLYEVQVMESLMRMSDCSMVQHPC